MMMIELVYGHEYYYETLFDSMVHDGSIHHHPICRRN